MKRHPAVLLKIKCQPSRNAQIDQTGTVIPYNVECNTENCSKVSTSVSLVSERLDERRVSTSALALLVELSPVPAIQTIACSRGRNKKTARELISKKGISAAKKRMSTGGNGSSAR
jgi:hypothetical protein